MIMTSNRSALPYLSCVLGVLIFFLVACAPGASTRTNKAPTTQPTNTPWVVEPLIASSATPPPRPSMTPAIAPNHAIIIEMPSGNSMLTYAPRAGNVFDAFDFLRDYLTNRTWHLSIEGKPWINTTVNVTQLQEELGGVTYWDFFSEPENWDSPFYMWQDDEGNWKPYEKQIVRDSAGRDHTSYLLLDRKGPGVMDRLWFTSDAVWMLTTEQSRKDVGPIAHMDDLVEWGNVDALGKLRIEVDNRIVYDGSVKDWLSGKAFRLTSELTQILTWRHREYGSNGNIIPILYQKRLRVLVYGGTKKPKWFQAAGVRLADDVRVKSYTGTPADLPIDEMTRLARTVLRPDEFINTLDNVRTFDLRLEPGNPATLQFNGAGTINALQFWISKRDDPKRLWLRIKYANTTTIDLPFVAFFGDQKHLVLHRSTPLGIVESDDAYVFYSNLPLPFQNGLVIELSSTNPRAVNVTARAAVTRETTNTQLWVHYGATQKLQMHGPDYEINLTGNGKLIGIVLQTEDQELDKIPKILVPGKPGVEDPVKRAWSMGYLEGNLALKDGLGNLRIFAGHEDWADGGFYFNRGYTNPPGGSNRPFGGILRYKDSKDGYATIFRYFNDLAGFPFKQGLSLAFGHGTWKNNFPVSYGATIYYYRQITLR